MINSLSNAGGFRVELIPALQLSDDANPGVTPIASALLIMLPGPDQDATEYLTVAGGTGGSWHVTITEAVAGVLGSAVLTVTVPNTHNQLWVALDPAVFSADKVYRVELRGNDNAICEQWDFRVYTIDSTPTGPSGLADINDAIRRIAGLLGYRQRVAYADYAQGIPREALIELMDGAGATLASYRRKLVVDPANQITGETSMALDANVL